MYIGNLRYNSEDFFLFISIIESANDTATALKKHQPKEATILHTFAICILGEMSNQ